MAGSGPQKRTTAQSEDTHRNVLAAHAAMYDDWLSNALGEDDRSKSDNNDDDRNPGLMAPSAN